MHGFKLLLDTVILALWTNFWRNSSYAGRCFIEFNHTSYNEPPCMFLLEDVWISLPFFSWIFLYIQRQGINRWSVLEILEKLNSATKIGPSLSFVSQVRGRIHNKIQYSISLVRSGACLFSCIAFQDYCEFVSESILLFYLL